MYYLTLIYLWVVVFFFTCLSTFMFPNANEVAVFQSVSWARLSAYGLINITVHRLIDKF